MSNFEGSLPGIPKFLCVEGSVIYFPPGSLLSKDPLMLLLHLGALQGDGNTGTKTSFLRVALVLGPLPPPSQATRELSAGYQYAGALQDPGKPSALKKIGRPLPPQLGCCLAFSSSSAGLRNTSYRTSDNGPQ